MKINFYNIYKQDRRIQSKIINNIKKIFKKGDFILGKDVRNFENKFSKSVNSKFAIGCANGTDAITLALKSLNLKKGSEVIIPAMTGHKTTQMVRRYIQEANLFKNNALNKIKF